ncbi:MAG: ABC transporter permease [Oscillospiraceae bacterium]
MYWNILKKDLKRKRTMNVILLVFIVLAAAFVSSSVNNLLSISTAMDDYGRKADLPDYLIFTKQEQTADVEAFLTQSGDAETYEKADMVFVSVADIIVNGEALDTPRTIVAGTAGEAGINIFNSDNQPITAVKNGEVWISHVLAQEAGVGAGDILSVACGESTLELRCAGEMKDFVFGSSMMGTSRILVSDADYAALAAAGTSGLTYYGITADDTAKLTTDFAQTGINAVFSEDRATMKFMYVMDMVIAGVMLIVSVCLILISAVILRFTIVFTLTEEFREIGVMKAIGISALRIRGLYIVKYFAMACVGALAGFAAGIPFGRLLLARVSANIVMENRLGVLVNLLCCAGVVLAVSLFAYLATGRLKKFSPIDAIRNGATGERFRRKGLLSLGKSRLPAVGFLAVNDITSGVRRYTALILTFVLGMLLINVPVNTVTTLSGDNIVSLFAVAKSDAYLMEELTFNSKSTRADVEHQIDVVKQKLDAAGIPAQVYKETIFRFSIGFNGHSSTSIAFQGTGVTADRYTYLEGSPPEHADEIAVTQLVADKIGAAIGDTILVKIGDGEKNFLVTALYQSMNNLGEGIRFHPDAELEYADAVGQFATQILYTDDPSDKVKGERMEQIKALFPDKDVYTGGEWVDAMIGGISGTIGGLNRLIVPLVLAINALVAVLMVKSMITREKGEIGMLKAVGFSNGALMRWQCGRIGIVLAAAILIGILLSTPVSQLTAGAVFRMMGAGSIDFQIKPLQVYLLYPALVFAATMLASAVTSLQIRRISASETSNIE